MDVIPNAGVHVFNCSAAVNINVPEEKASRRLGEQGQYGLRGTRKRKDVFRNHLFSPTVIRKINICNGHSL